MGVSALVPLAIGTGISALGQIQQGQQQADYYKEQAKQVELDGVTAKADAMTQAEKIRRLGKRQVSETKAQLAASGVKLGEGTPLELEHEITTQYENDAASELLTGNRAAQAAYTSAASMRNAGRNATSNSVLGAAGTVAEGWYMGKKG
jgi:hypothetical protein